MDILKIRRFHEEIRHSFQYAHANVITNLPMFHRIHIHNDVKMLAPQVVSNSPQAYVHEIRVIIFVFHNGIVHKRTVLFD